MDNEETARRRNREYYGNSPLEIFSDSYFTQAVQYDEHSCSFAPAGLGIQGYVGANYAHQVPQQTDYQPYQGSNPMDLDLLSAENYQEGLYPHNISPVNGSGSIELYGGLLATSPIEINPRSPPTAMRSQRSKKDASSADESGNRQRGRPRLDTRDQTAAEVIVSIVCIISG